MQSTEAKYREEAARRLLGEAAGRHSMHLEQRNEAARSLLKQFAELAKEYRLNIRTEDPETLRLLASREEAYILLRANRGWLYLATRAGDKPLSLYYDPYTQRLEGTEADPDIVPVPGELQPRRSALAVLASTVLNQMPPGGD